MQGCIDGGGGVEGGGAVKHGTPKRGSRAERKAGQKAGQTSRVPFSCLMDGCIQMNEGDRPNKEDRRVITLLASWGGGGEGMHHGLINYKDTKTKCHRYCCL